MAFSRSKYVLGCQSVCATNHQQFIVPFFSSSLLISISLANVSFSWGKILNDSDKHSRGTWLIHLMKHKLLCFWNKSAVGLSKGGSVRAGAQGLRCPGEETSAGLVQVKQSPMEIKMLSKPCQSWANPSWKTTLEHTSPRNVYYLLITHRYGHTNKLCTS